MLCGSEELYTGGMGFGQGGFREWRGSEVVGGDLEGVDEEAGTFEVHAVAGETGGDSCERRLDRGAVVEVLDIEGFVFDDGWDGFVAVAEAHEFVVHGVGSAAAAFVVDVHALVSDGRLAEEVIECLSHGVPPLGCESDFR